MSPPPAPALRGAFGKAWISALLFFSGMYAFAIPLPIWLEGLAIDDGAISIVLGTFGITSLAARPVAGMAVDRFGQRPLAIAGALALAAGTAIGFVADHVLVWVLARAVQATAYVTFTTATTALVARQTDTDRYARLALFGAAANVAMVVAPLLTDTRFESTGLRIPLVLSAGLALAAAIAVFTVPGAPPIRKAHIAFPAPLWGPGLLAVVFGIAWGVVFQFLALLADRRNLGPAAPLYVAYGLGIIATRVVPAAFTGRMRAAACWIRADQLGFRGKSLSAAFVTLGIGSIGLAILPASLCLPAVVLTAIGSGIIHPGLLNLSLARVSHGSQGRAVATFYLCFDLGIGGGSWLLGSALLATTAPGLFVVGGFVALGGALLSVLCNRPNASM